MQNFISGNPSKTKAYFQNKRLFLKKSFNYFGDNKNGFTFAPPLKEMTR